MQKRLSYALQTVLYLILVTPLFYSKSFVYPFLTPKIYVFQALVEIAFALWLILALFYKEYRPRFGWLTWSVAALLFTLTVASLRGLDPVRSFWSTQDRGLGLVALAHFAALYLILSSLPRFNWRRYFLTSIAVAGIAAIFAEIQMYVPKMFLESAGGRPGSFLGNPSFLASYLLFHIFIAGWFLTEYWRERNTRNGTFVFWALAAAELAMLWALLLTQTRGALLGFGAGLAVLLLSAALAKEPPRYWRFRQGKRIALGLILLGAMAAGIFWVTRTNPVWQSVPGVKRLATTSFTNASDIGPRLIALKIAWNSFLERPILGFGMENFKYPFDKRYDPKLLRFGFSETFFDKPHNIFMEYLVIGGILGLAAYLWLIIGAWWAMRRPELREFLPFGGAALAAYLVQNTFLFDTFGSYLALFILLAFIANPKPDAPAPAETRRLRPREWSAAGALILASVLAAYFVNWNILYANYEQYWGLNYFLNRDSQDAIDSYRRSINTPNPYQDSTRKDFASTVAQVFAEGVALPDPQNLAKEAMTGLALAINNHPNDYFMRTVFVDSAISFIPLDPAYVRAAEAQLGEAMKTNPNRQQTYYSAARLKVAEHNPGEALALMKKAVDLDPESADPHFYYGLTAFSAGDTALGIVETERAKALGREPKNASEARILAGYYADAGRYDEAIQSYKTALSYDSSDVETELKLGLTYYYAGNRELARNFLGDVSRKVDLTGSPFYQDLREIYRELGLSL